MNAHWAVDADDLDGAVDLHHREPTAGRGDRVALAHVGFLAGHQLVARRLPGRLVDDGRRPPAGWSFGLVIVVLLPTSEWWVGIGTGWSSSVRLRGAPGRTARR